MKALILALFFMSLNVLADPRIDELKSEIMTLARLSEGKPDTNGKLQAAIEEKVQDLEKIIPHLTMEEKARKIMGPWRQVFGPYSATGDGSIPFGSRTDHIYQIIFADGQFYNVALYEKAGFKMVFLLKGSYEVTSESIKGTFVKNSIVVRNIDEATLADLPAKLEARTIKAIHLPKSLPPVGLGGDLFEVYADTEIRILRGMTSAFERPALYIMERK